jgi:hypothetical protein
LLSTRLLFCKCKLTKAIATSLHIGMFVCQRALQRTAHSVNFRRFSLQPHQHAQLPASIARIVEAKHSKFLQVYSPSEHGSNPTVDFVQTYYRKPRPELLLGMLVEAFRTPGALCAQASFGSAVFLCNVLKTACKTTEDTASLLMVLRSTLVHSNGEDLNPSLQATSSEPMDTVLRALAMADQPHFDAILKDIRDTWLASLSHMSLDAAEDADTKLVIALATSILPPNYRQCRQPLMQWQIPCMNLDSFHKYVTTNEFNLYGATRYLFSLTHATYALSQQRQIDGAVMAPGVATHVTKCIVDGYWSQFYATGDAMAITRVLDVGTLYMPFLDEYGDAYVTEYATKISLPEEFTEDPLSAMKFECSRYALWTLLVNVGTHTAVGEIYMAQLAKIMNKITLMDPVSAELETTAFGKMRIELMKALFPTIQKLGNHASTHGIGSGTWPASYGEGMATVAPLLPSESIRFPAVHDAEDISSQVARLFVQNETQTPAHDAGSFGAVHTRDRRTVGGLRVR